MFNLMKNNSMKRSESVAGSLDSKKSNDPAWRQALQREFKIERDLNKYTRDNYNSIDRKML